MTYIKLELLVPKHFVLKAPAFKPVGLCKYHQEESYNEFIKFRDLLIIISFIRLRTL
jgi:hypothetical protein